MAEQNQLDDVDELDAILDQALDDFKEDDWSSLPSAQPKASETKEQQQDTSTAPAQSDREGETEEDIENMMKNLWKDVQGDEQDPDAMWQNMDKFLKQFADEVAQQQHQHPESSSSSTAPPPSSSSHQAGQQQSSSDSTNPASQDEFQKNLFETLRMVSDSTQRLETEEQETGPAPDMLSQLFGSLDSGDLDVDNVVGNLVKHLMSKDIMYEPMKDTVELYPEWLEENKDNAAYSKEQMESYRKQHVELRKLVDMYDSIPDDHEKLFEQMEEVSKCGQPPEDLLKRLGGDGGLPMPDPSQCRPM